MDTKGIIIKMFHKMKKSFIIIIVLIFSFPKIFAQTGQEEGIEFNSYSWAYIVGLAKVQHKLIFLDAYTSWCSPCKWVAKNIFTNHEVAEYYNKTFINTSFDMEKGEGRELAKKFQVDAYPTFLFINGDEKIIYRQSGIKDNKKFYSAFIQYGKTAMENESNTK